MKTKHAILILTTIALSYSCNSDAQNQAKEQAEKTQKAMKATMQGTIPTTTTGYTMRAKIDGKNWVADAMMPPDYTGRIIGCYGKEYISLPYNKDTRSMKVGIKTIFSEEEVVDLATNEVGGMWGGRKGEMEITKVSDQWVEGKFFFTATSTRSPQKREVTEGFFRIPFPKH
jgi:hypothetical protein